VLNKAVQIHDGVRGAASIITSPLTHTIRTLGGDVDNVGRNVYNNPTSAAAVMGTVMAGAALSPMIPAAVAASPLFYMGIPIAAKLTAAALPKKYRYSKTALGSGLNTLATGMSAASNMTVPGIAMKLASAYIFPGSLANEIKSAKSANRTDARWDKLRGTVLSGNHLYANPAPMLPDPQVAERAKARWKKIRDAVLPENDRYDRASMPNNNHQATIANMPPMYDPYNTQDDIVNAPRTRATAGRKSSPRARAMAGRKRGRRASVPSKHQKTIANMPPMYNPYTTTTTTTTATQDDVVNAPRTRATAGRKSSPRARAMAGRKRGRRPSNNRRRRFA
jgi:hypothetical protein